MTGHWFELLAGKGKSHRRQSSAVAAGDFIQASIRRSKNPSTDAATPGEYDRIKAVAE
jgi:hypothetical protein